MKSAVSFDFDGTLDRKDVQNFARMLVNRGFNVHIVTCRYDDITLYSEEFKKKYGIVNLEKEFAYLFEVADNVGIDRENIHFTNMEMKFTFFEEHPEFLLHLDDDSLELRAINHSTHTIAVSSKASNYRQKMLRILNDWSDE